MVMENRIPKNKWERLIQIPPIKIQMILNNITRQPEELLPERTSDPKGHKASMASFNVCSPNGIPIMVIIRSTLDMRYSIEMMMPPKTSQIILPRIFMVLVLMNRKVIKNGEAAMIFETTEANSQEKTLQWDHDIKLTFAG
jgi:hypothetical protein